MASGAMLPRMAVRAQIQDVAPRLEGRGEQQHKREWEGAARFKDGLAALELGKPSE